MKCKSLIAIALLACCGTALADQQIASVQVTAKPDFALQFSCASPSAPSRADVERLLKINQSTQTPGLAHKLMAAVGEACNAGVASIQVHRAATGQSLSWKVVRADERSVAAN